MKNYSFITLLFLSALSQAQIVDIPDTNFKNALVNTICADLDGDGTLDGDVDINNDGEIQLSEAEAVFRLSVSDENINSLEGIQSFEILELLWCGGNQLTNLDVTQNSNLYDLRTEHNALTSLDVTQNPNLEVLYCYHNDLTSLDVTQNPDLVYLSIYSNQISNIDVTQNPNLVALDFKSNYLSSIDVTQNPNLEHLVCFYNQLTSLDVTQNPNLFRLAFGGNQLTNLDVTQNSNLYDLYCGGNQLTNLDVTQNPNLFSLNCRENQLTSLDISQNPNLEGFSCQENLLTSLNIKNGSNQNLIIFRAYNNPNLNCIQVDDVVYANNQNCNDDYWCKDNWAEYSEGCVLATQDFNLQHISLYPNPVQNNLNINTQFPIEQIKIYTLQGQLIQETSNNQIDVSLLSSGLYFASIIIDGKNSIKMFIKD